MFSTCSGTDLAQQRVAAIGLPRVRGSRASAGNVAHVSTDALVLGARQGRSENVIAQLMGHAKVDTTLNVYTQVLDGSVRTAVQKVGNGLFTIVHNPETGVELSR